MPQQEEQESKKGWLCARVEAPNTFTTIALLARSLSLCVPPVACQIGSWYFRTDHPELLQSTISQREFWLHRPQLLELHTYAGGVRFQDVTVAEAKTTSERPRNQRCDMTM
eukprot:1386798-Amphidinium_carterae.1